MMGLRLKEGIDLSIPMNKKAFEFYKHKIKYASVRNGRLVADDINKIDDTLIELIE
jgi:hypothetical protein